MTDELRNAEYEERLEKLEERIAAVMRDIVKILGYQVNASDRQNKVIDAMAEVAEAGKRTAMVVSVARAEIDALAAEVADIRKLVAVRREPSLS